MSSLVSHILASALLGAIIGAVAGWGASEFMPESAVGGAVIGALVGVYFGIRMQAYRVARRNPEAVAHKSQQRKAQSRTLRQFSPTGNRGDSIKVGSIHGEMDRFKDGSSPN
jgi:hypothetical protein